MKAAVLDGVEKLSVREVPKPEVPEGGLLVRVKACAICSTDVKIYRRGYSGIVFPFILGHELTGTIAEIGRGVAGYEVGERVAIAPNMPCGKCWFCRNCLHTACDNLRILGVHVNGGFAEYVSIPLLALEQGCINIMPDNVSFEEATLLDPLSCAINAAELSNVKEGDTVVVIGAGPTGCLNTEICKSRGARVILVQRSLGRLEQARFTGADIYVSPLNEDVQERVKKETDGRGADVVIVACGSGEAQQEALQMVRKRGNVNFFGGLPRDNPFIKLNSNLVHYKEFYIIGTHGGSSRHCREALNLIHKGKIKAKEYLTRRFPLDDFLEGINLAEMRQVLKAIIQP